MQPMTPILKHREFFTPFSLWVADNLPSEKTGYMVGDVDKIFYNYKTQRLMLVEEKCLRDEVKEWYARLIREVLHPALKHRCGDIGIDYRGFHLVQFEKERPDDGGQIWLDRKPVTREELRVFLSMDEESEDAEIDETINIARSL